MKALLAGTNEAGMGRARRGALALVILFSVCAATAATEANPSRPSTGGNSISYHNDKVEEVPWSIHIVRLNRSNPDYELHTTLGKGRVQGLSTLSEQIKGLPGEWGRPVAAINGDFWADRSNCTGDPLGLQISEGELVSGPGERSCFWIDAAGQPHTTNVVSLFTVTWPTGQKVPFGLNCERLSDGAVLYTSAVGGSTRTSRGRELILEKPADGPWLPLQISETYTARVREVRDTGDAPVSPGTMVLSLGSQVAARLTAIAPGATLKISTATLPDLNGAKTAIGGGPTLVRHGKAQQWNGNQPRHPRTAIGWNATNFFLVQVDGRQG